MAEADCTKPPGPTKVCATCGETKPLDEFTRNAGRKDGRTPYCRPCWRARGRAAYAIDSDRHRERNRQYHRDNQEAVRGRRAKTAERRREVARVLNANKKAARLGVPGVLTVEGVAARFALWGGLCYLCGRVAVEIDHVIALTTGGPNVHANIRPCCRSCNAGKADRRLGTP
jgi:hypothetical protein